ncbi:hypothetical protein V6N12_058511 [Hibiscus sabdariffa]|uniref:Uncharacterized protein n=1 Tax=Hibiscus sabdariffa TaxID=183260 RepID=A0ABR2EUA7_9ROSI
MDKRARCQGIVLEPADRVTDAGTHIEFADEVLMDVTGDMSGLDDAGEARVSSLVGNWSGTFPTIIFSDRVHNQIDRNMRNSVIVRILGRTIGFKAFLGQIHVIWKPLGGDTTD